MGFASHLRRRRRSGRKTGLGRPRSCETLHKGWFFKSRPWEPQPLKVGRGLCSRQSAERALCRLVTRSHFRSEHTERTEFVFKETSRQVETCADIHALCARDKSATAPTSRTCGLNRNETRTTWRSAARQREVLSGADFVPAKLPRRLGPILIDIRFSNETDLNQSGSSNHGRWNGIDKLFTIDLISARSTCLRQLR